MADVEQEAPKVVHDLGDPKIVRELFDMAGREVLYRLVQVSRKVLAEDKARDMDDALARHLSRALMGENPEFRGVQGWSGMPCALSLASVEPSLFGKLKDAEEHADLANPRLVMVLAMTTFYQSVYAAIRKEIVRDSATQESVQKAVDEVVGRFALAAMKSQNA